MSMVPSESVRAGHACCLYSAADQQYAGVLPFFRARLEGGHQCILVTADTQAAMAAMRKCGMDPDGAIRRGALIVRETGPVLHDVEFWREARSSAASAGYSGLTFSTEMDGFLTAGVPPDGLLAYEQCLNSLFAEGSCSGVCLYNLNRIPADLVVSILLAHPHLMRSGVVFPNPFSGGGGRRPWVLSPGDFEGVLGLVHPPAEAASLAALPGVTTFGEVTAKLQDGDPQGIADLYGTFYRGTQFLLSRHMPAGIAGELAHAVLCTAVQEIRRRDCDPDHVPQLILELVRSQVDSRVKTEETPPDRRPMEAMLRVLSGVSAVDRDALIRHYVGGQTEAEVSSALGVNLRRLRSLKSRVRSAFEKSKTP